jgi:hypothetical protein
VSGWHTCRCAVPTQSATIPPTAHTDACTVCLGSYVLCVRCRRPLYDGTEHGLGKCHAPTVKDAIDG